MNVIVLNCGSSSLKYRLLDMDDESVLATGMVERIGLDQDRLRHRYRDLQGEMRELRREQVAKDHREAFAAIVAAFTDTRDGRDDFPVHAVGHRAVHGGQDFREPTLIDDRVLASIRRNAPKAPLHNPANLIGIELAMELFEGVPQVAVFDTAFHQTLPPRAYHYALPLRLYQEHDVRRYGFHGTSFSYVSRRAAEFLGKPLDQTNLIVLHLGNGASACAIANGKSVETSMGMTPLEGLVMGTRCGDLDPGLPEYLRRELGATTEELEQMLQKESGLKGLAGVQDMRTVTDRAATGDERAQLAIDVFCHRLKKYVGAYYAVLGRVDALVFTGGIGENSPLVRATVCEGLERLGLTIARQRNDASDDQVRSIAKERSEVDVLVVPTDEELEIARQTVRCVRAAHGRELDAQTTNGA